MNIKGTVVLVFASALMVVTSVVTDCRAQWNLQATQAEQDITTSHPMEITHNKTSSIIFSALIKSVDKGSKDILVQKARDVGNVLQIKAAKEKFEETNLTVITADGVLHHFTVNYVQEPGTLTFDMSVVENAGMPSKLIFSSDMTETLMEEYAEGIVNSKRITYFKRQGKHKIAFSLLGIYIKGNVIFYRLRIRNGSNIGYDVDFLKFFVRDNAQIKRTASQEVEAKPMFRYGNASTVAGRSETEIVYALEKFTIPDSKHLAIELFEKKGGRHCQLRIKNKAIVKAKLL